MPGGHHIELFGAALEAAARHAAHFSSGAIAEHFVEQIDGLRHVDEFSRLRFADNHGHVWKILHRFYSVWVKTGQVVANWRARRQTSGILTRAAGELDNILSGASKIY